MVRVVSLVELSNSAAYRGALKEKAQQTMDNDRATSFLNLPVLPLSEPPPFYHFPLNSGEALYNFEFLSPGTRHQSRPV